jgi:hypothetical protein
MGGWSGQQSGWLSVNPMRAHVRLCVCVCVYW